MDAVCQRHCENSLVEIFFEVFAQDHGNVTAITVCNNCDRLCIRWLYDLLPDCVCVFFWRAAAFDVLSIALVVVCVSDDNFKTFLLGLLDVRQASSSVERMVDDKAPRPLTSYNEL